MEIENVIITGIRDEGKGIANVAIVTSQEMGCEEYGHTLFHTRIIHTTISMPPKVMKLITSPVCTHMHVDGLLIEFVRNTYSGASYQLLKSIFETHYLGLEFINPSLRREELLHDFNLRLKLIRIKRSSDYLLSKGELYV